MLARGYVRNTSINLTEGFMLTGAPTMVDLGIYINGFYDISEQTMVSLSVSIIL